jgi:hypothetical protein
MTNLVLPAEGTYYDFERDMIDNEPPGLFPGDQISYFGVLRNILAEHMQLNIINRMDQWYLNLDPRTVGIEDLPEWEEQLGLPPIPHDYITAVPEAFRRALIISRHEQGPFTRERRDRVIEQFVAATFGHAVSFGLDGLSLDPGGVPLAADTAVLHASYRVYEDVRNYAYEVQIVNTINPDVTALLRELKRITPAPTSANVVVNNSLSEINDYGLAMRNLQPAAYYRLAGNAQDSSGYANHGTLNGSPSSVAPPGLLHPAASAGGAYDFDGVDDYVSIPSSSQVGNITHGFALHTVARMAVLPAAGHYRPMIANASLTDYLLINELGAVVFSAVLDGVQQVVQSANGVAPINTTLHIVGNYNTAAKRMELWVNNSVVASATKTGNAAMTGIWYIGAGVGDFFRGVIDEAVIFDRTLTSAEIAELYNQSIGVVT